ncbi:hypothetical protein SAMN04487917_109111 [Arthrobacter sp. yr096]|nr:hypothetical protein SAMN04487917_109111 [Arthrobacter sp. yr096]
MTSPATDLHDAVTKWYARRNATAHYGKFVIDDATQQRQSWYNRALATTSSDTGIDQWMWTFKRTVEHVLNAEMNRVGRSLL